MCSRTFACAVVVLVVLSGCGSTGAIRLSRDRISDRGIVTLTGHGFPTKSIVYSHVKRPDGTEFPPLRFLTDENGEFTHNIDTFTLQEGTHEVWVVDGKGRSTGVSRFVVSD
jgi:hypothetical protein